MGRMYTTFDFTQGDTLAAVGPVTLTDAELNPIDLTGLTVAFRMVTWNVPNAVAPAVPVVIVNNAAAENLQATDPSLKGMVRYRWQPVDVANAGLYEAWFLVTNGTATEHFPRDGSFIIRINPAV